MEVIVKAVLHRSRSETGKRRSDQRAPVPRRSLLIGAAWSAPTAIVATAAPAIAASPAGTLEVTPSWVSLRYDQNLFSYSFRITNTASEGDIHGPFTLTYNVPFDRQGSIANSASNPQLFGIVSFNSSPSLELATDHTTSSNAVDSYGNYRAEKYSIGNQSTVLSPGASITLTVQWTIPSNWTSTGDDSDGYHGGQIGLGRRMWTWRTAGSVSARSGASNSPASFPSWTEQAPSENPASPGGLFAFSWS